MHEILTLWVQLFYEDHLVNDYFTEYIWTFIGLFIFYCCVDISGEVEFGSILFLLHCSLEIQEGILFYRVNSQIFFLFGEVLEVEGQWADDVVHSRSDREYLCSSAVLILKLSSVYYVRMTIYGCSYAFISYFMDFKGSYLFFFLFVYSSSQKLTFVMTRMHFILLLFMCRVALVE